MITSKPSRPLDRRRLALVVGAILACGLLTMVPLVTGCGSIPSGGSSTMRPPVAAAAATTAEPRVTAAAVATGAIDTWSELMQRLVGLLEDNPQPDAIRTEVEDLKEEYIQRLVVFGWQRSELTAAEQKEMSSLTSIGMEELAEESWYVDYMSLYDHYSRGDLDFADLLASFNILTQYADFELLKQQAPEEAARLDIE